jgi:hypothetical protein
VKSASPVTNMSSTLLGPLPPPYVAMPVQVMCAPNGREPLVGEWHLTASSLTRYLNEARFGAGRDGARPAVIDPGILVDGPTQLLETLRKRCERPPNRRTAEKGEPSPGGALCKRDRDQSRAKQDKTGNGDGAETVRSEFITHGTAYRSRSTGIYHSDALRAGGFFS